MASCILEGHLFVVASSKGNTYIEKYVYAVLEYQIKDTKQDFE